MNLVDQVFELGLTRGFVCGSSPAIQRVNSVVAEVARTNIPILRAASRQTERELILRALERTRWNRKRAAQELQISYKSLLSKLKQIGNPGAASGKGF